jgi:hypothetical protein
MIEWLKTKNGGVVCDKSKDSQTAIKRSEAGGKPE